jgi:hypothetical protein
LPVTLGLVGAGFGERLCDFVQRVGVDVLDSGQGERRGVGQRGVPAFNQQRVSEVERGGQSQIGQP